MVTFIKRGLILAVICTVLSILTVAGALATTPVNSNSAVYVEPIIEDKLSKQESVAFFVMLRDTELHNNRRKPPKLPESQQCLHA